MLKSEHAKINRKKPIEKNNMNFYVQCITITITVNTNYDIP